MATHYAVQLLTIAQQTLASATRSLANDKVFEAERSVTAAELLLTTAIKSLKAAETKPPSTGWYV